MKQAMVRAKKPTPAALRHPLPTPKSSGELASLIAPTYLASDRAVLLAWLALSMNRPLLVEGPPGVGKTDLARALAEALQRPLLRLQCYEGLDESKALYEWNYAKQMLATQIARSDSAKKSLALYTEDFLLPRPLLASLTSEVPTVLLIDEVDRADPEFEAFLLEYLSEGQVTIPEFGTVRAKHAPLVVLTTNATRDMTDALRRRCLHLFLDYPPPAVEAKIIEMRVPGIAAALSDELATYVQKVRSLDLKKAPSIAETVDWARALVLLGKSSLSANLVEETLAVLLKHEEDRAIALRSVK